MCPSGAIQIDRKDGNPAEQPPEVNTCHIRESGPLAIRATLIIDSKLDGYRATLCRCGQSKNKPYCDGSHHDAGFAATGEPETGKTDALQTRGGALDIRPQRNGPLAVTGPLEICSGTGRVVARTQATRLCRCGHSENKPFCDGSHARAGFVSE
ncbi:CDGSH iron-sulfur domain-containing protein [Sphingorhabdus arenilitoris]|uniref:CDGSH iron-sulfur domain-containing protein n=1 Tax=Sphingorhabdus arenilitoris TaxID=1490041 RepID=A0ABV8RGK9_9SPHN